MTPRLILASGSPRRSLLLSAAGYEIDVRVPDVAEIVKPGEPAAEAVLRISALKAEAIDRLPGEAVLAADTMVVLEGTPLGKPRDRADAARMLSSLSNRTHSVMTGWTIRSDVGDRFGVSESWVTFKKLTSESINEYIRDEQPFDKAGAYGIQGEDGRLVLSVSGSRANVMGLPLRDIAEALLDVGIERSAPHRGETDLS